MNVKNHQPKERTINDTAAAVTAYHTHSIPLDMEDIERDWDRPVADAGLAAKTSVIMRVGALDLGAGTGSFRVREMMHRIAYPLGVHVRADINLTDIDATCTDGKSRVTEVVDLPTTGVNTERIWLLEHFADWFSVNLGKTSMYHARPRVSEELVEQLGNPEAQKSLLRAVKKVRRMRDRNEKVRAKRDERIQTRGYKAPKGEYEQYFDHIGQTVKDGANSTGLGQIPRSPDQPEDVAHAAGLADDPTARNPRASASYEKAVADAATVPVIAPDTAPAASEAFPAATHGVTVGQVHERLNLIERRRPLYSPWFSGLASAVACACFVFLLGGGPLDMLGAFVGAGIGQWVRRRMFAHHLNQFFVTFVAVAVAAFACVGTLRFVGLIDPAALSHDTAYIGAMLFVIPGFPLITGGLDIAKIDFPSGIQRLTYTLSIILMATLAGWMVATVVHLNPQGFEPMGLNPWLNTALRAAAAFGGVWGFSVLFNSPQRMCFTAAAIGAITDTLRLTLTDFGMPPEAAAFIGALLAGLLASGWRSMVRHGMLPPHLGYPRICLTVPSIVIMVPGLYMYRAMFYLGQFNTANALDWGFRAFMVILCLPIGLAMARVITDKSWRYDI
ncbi:Putative threonine/serine exporter [Bifidobacterium bohemicum]|uniref:Putative membrane protein n=1 Tax=Bifidobacterium bohemicum DSM 22767 TaxID=1437606 RepID=A0A086ZH72_9BIFI|nr:threonine/serine exporter family protein [Bifidobacterium bohemicum]KFI45872.1 putative membrane protein [Bifidobacterium bohemicum DSM 22767]SCC16087.1 Putative threonine/serine exporter [Bifidobacterium bohemicum]